VYVNEEDLHGCCLVRMPALSSMQAVKMRQSMGCSENDGD